jgi:hypothetical protein
LTAPTPGEGFRAVVAAPPFPLELRFRLLVVLIGEERLLAPPLPPLGAATDELVLFRESKLAARERLPVELGARETRSWTGASSGDSAVRDNPKPWLRLVLDPLVSLRE